MAPSRAHGYPRSMESASDLRKELEGAIATTRRRINAAELELGRGFPVEAVGRDRVLNRLRHTLAELEQALANVETGDA